MSRGAARRDPITFGAWPTVTLLLFFPSPCNSLPQGFHKYISKCISTHLKINLYTSHNHRASEPDFQGMPIAHVLNWRLKLLGKQYVVFLDLKVRSKTTRQTHVFVFPAQMPPLGTPKSHGNRAPTILGKN